MLCASTLKQCKKEYAQLTKKMDKYLYSDDDQTMTKEEYHLLDEQIKELVEGRYSEEVFYYYKKKKPTLIECHTGKEVSWENAFGGSFESVSKSLRHSLVGLVEGGGRYRLK